MVRDGETKRYGYGTSVVMLSGAKHLGWLSRGVALRFFAALRMTVKRNTAREAARERAGEAEIQQTA